MKKIIWNVIVAILIIIAIYGDIKMVNDCNNNASVTEEKTSLY